MTIKESTAVQTRKFGLRPVDAGHEPCQHVLSTAFSRFQVAVNVMIRHGVRLHSSNFEGKGTQAPKRFYNRITRMARVKNELSNVGVRERLLRCAAQPAYFAIREFKTRASLIPLLVDLIVSKHDIERFLGRDFPADPLVRAARDTIEDSGIEGASLSRVDIENKLRHVRNLVRGIVLEEHCEYIKDLVDDVILERQFFTRLRETTFKALPDHAGQFIHSLSRRLTSRYNRVHGSRKGKKKSTTSFGSSPLDEQIATILAASRGKTIGKRGEVKWQRARKEWRDGAIKELPAAIKREHVAAMIEDAVARAREELEPARLVNYLFKPKMGKYHATNDSVDSFKEHVMPFLVAAIKKEIVKRVENHVHLCFSDALKALAMNPARYLNVPRFKQCTIPLGPGEAQVFELEYRGDEVLASVSFFTRAQLGRVVPCTRKACKRRCGGPGCVKESTMRFRLGTIERFVEMLDQGLVPRRGVLSKKNGGGLVLHVPFESRVQGQGVQKWVDLEGATCIVAGVDLGLKTLAVISIDELRCIGYGAWESTERYQGDKGRYFIDQRQLAGPKDGWFSGERVHGLSFPNFKRKLVNLQRQAYQLQSKLDRFKNAHPGDYKSKQGYFVLHREWTRAWEQINNIHDEMSKQVATRIVAACEHEGVQVIRMEDLSWAKHTAKQEAGYFLATWQVHWFYSRIQDLVSSMARRAGMFVEMVDPRYTSKDCHECKRRGDRSQERPLRAAARQRPQRGEEHPRRTLIRGGYTRPRRVPVTTHSPNRDELALDVQLCRGLK
jgi:IS605 OrfB family transposase